MAQKRGYRILDEGTINVNWAPRYPVNRNYGNSVTPVSWNQPSNIPFRRYRICSVIYMNNTNPASLPSVAGLALAPTPQVVTNVNTRFESFMFRFQNNIRSTWTSFYPGCLNLANGVNFGISTRISDNNHVALDAYPNLTDPVMTAAGGDIPNPLTPNPIGTGFISNWAAYNNYITSGGTGGGLRAALANNVVQGATQATGVLAVDINFLRVPYLGPTAINDNNNMPLFTRTLAVGEAVGNAIVGTGRSNVLVMRSPGIGDAAANAVNRRIVNMFVQPPPPGVTGAVATETPAHEFGHMMGLEDRYIGLGYMVNRDFPTSPPTTTPLSNIPLNNIRVGGLGLPSTATMNRWENNGYCMVYPHNVQPNPAMYLPGPFSYRTSSSNVPNPVISSLSFNNQGQYLPPYLVPNFSQFYDPEYSMFFGWRHNLMSTAQAVMNPENPANFSNPRFAADAAFLQLYQGGSLFHNERVTNLAQGTSLNAFGVQVPTIFITAVQLNIILDNEANKVDNTIPIGNNRYIHDVEEYYLLNVRSIGVDDRNLDPAPPAGSGSATRIPAIYNPLITHNFVFAQSLAQDVFMRWAYFIDLNSTTASALLANIPFNNMAGTFVGLAFNATSTALDTNRPSPETLHIVHDDKFTATGAIGVDDVMDFRMIDANDTPSAATTPFLRSAFFPNFPSNPSNPNDPINILPISGMNDTNNANTNLFQVALIGQGLLPTALTSVPALSIGDAFAHNRAALEHHRNASQIYYAPQPNILNFLANPLTTPVFGFRTQLIASQNNPPAGDGRSSIVPSTQADVPWQTMWNNYNTLAGAQPIIITSPIQFTPADPTNPTNRNRTEVLNYLSQVLQNLGIIDNQNRQNGVNLTSSNVLSNGSTFARYTYNFDDNSIVQSPLAVANHGNTINEYSTNQNRFNNILGSSRFRTHIWNARETMLANALDTNGGVFSVGSSALVTTPANILDTPSGIMGGLPAGWANTQDGTGIIVRFFIFDSFSFVALANLNFPPNATQGQIIAITERQRTINNRSLYGVEITTRGVQLYRNRDLLIRIS